jgi:hypothetical protein
MGVYALSEPRTLPQRGGNGQDGGIRAAQTTYVMDCASVGCSYLTANRLAGLALQPVCVESVLIRHAYKH